ncbi:MAG: type II toxin-antitoxin system death-on-curing family toxin, partial [Gammaproteobacteria bacterium]|nr:type II toxin-antitoxin system death-on-curing family toxin [Gammaproteobacteria bacterium]
LIVDVYDLAACCACFIAVGHCFHDANKRTAHTAMQLILKLNGTQLDYDIKSIGDMIIKAAQGIIEETELAAYLRSLPSIPIA